MSHRLSKLTGILVLGLMIGCSSGGGGETPANVVVVNSNETPDASETNSSTTATDSSNPDPINDAIPQFITSACGTLPMSNAVQSNDSSSPTRMSAGQIVSGRIDPNSATNNEHFWSIPLEAGYYHVVFDSERADKQSSNLGMRLIDLMGSPENDDVPMIFGDQIAFRARNYAFIEVTEARVMQIRATPNYDAEDYQFAIFRNGNAVPSPFLIDCPTVQQLSIDTAEALVLPGATGWVTDRWYRVDLEASTDYLLNSWAAMTSGLSGDIQYDITYVDQFGQDDRFETTNSVNETDISTTGSGEVIVAESGPFWLRIQNKNQNELNVDFALLIRGD